MSHRHLVLGILASACLVATGCSDDSTGTNYNNVNNNNSTPPVCGNGQHEGTEECDGADLGGETCQTQGLPGGNLACYPNCTFDTTNCDPPVTCGNGTVDEPQEECDGSLLNGQTCITLGYASGTLTCAGNCQFDESQCDMGPECGDGTIDAGEQCDGANLDQQTCESRGYASGPLSCTPDTCLFDETGCVPAPDCGNGQLDGNEQCDGANLNGQTCESQGYDGGTLACTGGCLFNSSGCYACGDGVRNGNEDCDGSDFGLSTCATATSHASGDLACLSDCTLDTSDCYTCGDAQLDGPEACDGVNLANETCPSLTSLPDGPLGCAASCLSFDTSACHECGNGVLEGMENCDDNGQQVDDGCNANCAIEAGWSCAGAPSVCVEICGDGTIVGSEGCDDGNVTDGDGCGTTCQPEAGWNCAGQPTTCTEICGDGIRVGVEQCDDGNSTDWDGCTSCAITEFQVNVTTASLQRSPDVARTGNGEFVIVWGGPDSNAGGVYARSFYGDATPETGELLVNTYTQGTQMMPAVAATADGSFVVAWESIWQDADWIGIFAQQYAPSNAPFGVEFLVNTEQQFAQEQVAVAMSDSGSFVMAWASVGQDADGIGVFAQRFDPMGLPVGTEFQVNTSTTDHQENPAVAMHADGSFVITWFSGDHFGGWHGLFAQRYDSAGNPVGTEFQVNTTGSGGQDSSAAVDPLGQIVIVWQSWNQDGDGAGVSGQRYDAIGVPLGPEFQINTYSMGHQSDPSVSAAADGSFVVAWESDGQDGSGYGVYGQRYDSAGIPAGIEFQVNIYTAGNQMQPEIVMQDGGGFVIAWHSDGQDGDGLGVYAQRFDSTGIPLGVGP